MTIENLTSEEWKNRDLYDRKVTSKILPGEDWTAYKKGNWEAGPSAVDKVSHAVYQILTSPVGFKDTLDYGSEIVPGLTLEEMLGALFHAEKRLKELRKIEELYGENIE